MKIHPSIPTTILNRLQKLSKAELTQKDKIKLYFLQHCLNQPLQPFILNLLNQLESNLEDFQERKAIQEFS